MWKQWQKCSRVAKHRLFVELLATCSETVGSELNYHLLMKRRLSKLEKGVPIFLGEKHEVKKFARFVGVRVPQQYFYGQLSDLDFGQLPSEFVLKPDFASTSQGVRLLEKRGNALYDLQKNEEFNRESVLEEERGIALKYFEDTSQGNFHAEELLRDHDGSAPIPDVRCYCFNGVIGMIVIERHITPTTRELMYFDGNFLPFVDTNERYSVAEVAKHLDTVVEAIVPKNWEALKLTAERISSAVPSPFVRVDLYDVPNGVYLGELTFEPGPYYYKNRLLMSQAESARLGRLWLEAEERLVKQGVIPVQDGMHEVA